MTDPVYGETAYHPALEQTGIDNTEELIMRNI